MSTTHSYIPAASYGVSDRTRDGSACDLAVEQVRRVGFAVLDAGYDDGELSVISDAFGRVHYSYIATHGEARLRRIDEVHTIRALLTQQAGGNTFLGLALNARLMTVLRQLIQGKFILNQQNGILNPPHEGYNQSAWHRDLPYQHFVSSRPLAINALFCVDDFTLANGATFVLPASHKDEAFPSKPYVETNALQVVAKAGSFILLDCMMFHAGGFNTTSMARRAVNHVYTIPYFKQQIQFQSCIDEKPLSADEREMLGFPYTEPHSVAQYLVGRAANS